MPYDAQANAKRVSEGVPGFLCETLLYFGYDRAASWGHLPLFSYEVYVLQTRSVGEVLIRVNLWG